MPKLASAKLLVLMFTLGFRSASGSKSADASSPQLKIISAMDNRNAFFMYGYFIFLSHCFYALTGADPIFTKLCF
jgi:hypothetical protein